MTLKEHIEDIRKRLEQKEYTGEAAVRQGIIDRLLGILNWSTFDIKVVYPEYPVDNGNVDYALCHPKSEPRAFIEVKRVGNIDKGTKQLFDYAYRIGVTILILTDGQRWRFYHPAGEGSYEDRMVVELDLIAESSEECCNYLERYLNYNTVKSGKAAKVIASDYQRIVSKRKIDERLPEIWSELLQEKNEYLLLAIMEKAKDKVGHEPTEEQVVTFLKNLTVQSVKPKSVSKVVPEKLKQDKKNLKKVKKKLSPLQRLQVTFPNQPEIDHNHAKDTFVEALEKLGLENVMRIRPKIVSKEPFYPDREDRSVQRGEFYINVHSNSSYKKSCLESVAEQLGEELKVELIEK